MGVLATLVDMVAGSPAHSIINPTVDLRVSLLAPAPTSGAIELVTYPVKSGRLLFIGETLLHTGDLTRPFARSVCTFMNKPLDSERTGIFPVGHLGADHYDASLQTARTGTGSLRDGQPRDRAQRRQRHRAGRRAGAARRGRR